MLVQPYLIFSSPPLQGIMMLDIETNIVLTQDLVSFPPLIVRTFH
uniref:Uncharacterized protein n=1 Tax=Nelumbo nucifera TaxID=4432 RepID=A0A822ZI46_NELNU|nr:TPA_asm: hypothetical protein HUJ06_003042 [Nelumbo nucifera]